VRTPAKLAAKRDDVTDRPLGAAPAAPASASAGRGLDSESQWWIRSLEAPGAERALATERLHALLLRAARFEVARRAAQGPKLGRADLEEIAQQSADDALLAVLSKLGSFRGESRFTTWAYKFALLEAAVKVRRRRWQDREILLDPQAWPEPAVGRASEPHEQLEVDELLAAVRAAIESELTPHQREVLVSVALNGVPIDVLAERLGTTRGALYKTIHDARAKLRAALQASGHALEPAVKGGRK
jgi:RNA polymerase sigma-70 factor (ECF subfamily)